MFLVDSHCHLDYEGPHDSPGEAIRAAELAGVGLMVTISTRVAEFDSKIRPLIERFDAVYGSIGTHPHNAGEETDVTTDELVALAAHPKVVAIGEAGLDYHYDYGPRELQEQGFRRHIEAARQTGLPLVIHSRDADDDMAQILEQETADQGAFPFVLHCFTGGRALAERALALGGYVSFSGVITFKNAKEIQAIAADLPEDRILVETDSPYLAPAPHRGKKNQPAHIVHTAAKLAELRGVSPDEIAAITSRNFFRLFSKAPQPQAFIDGRAA